jgi:neuralized-like protein 2
MFHSFHGSNILLSDDRKCAIRIDSYNKALTFSSSPIHPNEEFNVEIVGVDNQWVGGIRLGFTLQNPSTPFYLPDHSLPDLQKSWLIGFTEDQYTNEHSNILIMPDSQEPYDHLYNRDFQIGVGTRLGLKYRVENNKVYFHILYNGEDCGTYATICNYDATPLYAGKLLFFKYIY